MVVENLKSAIFKFIDVLVDKRSSFFFFCLILISMSATLFKEVKWALKLLKVLGFPIPCMLGRFQSPTYLERLIRYFNLIFIESPRYLRQREVTCLYRAVQLWNCLSMKAGKYWSFATHDLAKQIGESSYPKYSKKIWLIHLLGTPIPYGFQRNSMDIKIWLIHLLAVQSARWK